MTPKVAIILPSLNRPTQLRAIVERSSLQSQTPQMVIIEQTSQQTKLIRNGVPLITIHSPEIRGSALSRNIGIEVAIAQRATYLCFWDDDDLPQPGYIRRMSHALDRNPSALTSKCRVLFEGKVLPLSNEPTAGRMLRVSALQCRRWEFVPSQQDQRFWAPFKDYKTTLVDEVLYESVRNPVGGRRP